MSTWLWLKALPWKWIGAAAVLGAALWFYRHQLAEAEAQGYDRAVAENNAALAVALTRTLEAERKLREADRNASHMRASELASVRAEYAARPDSVIRVCVNAPSSIGPMPGAGGDPGGDVPAAPGTGALPEGVGQNAATDFDPAPLYDQARQCDEIVAYFRAIELRNKTAF